MIEPIRREQLNACLNIFKTGYERTAVEFGMTEDNCPYRGRTRLPYQVFEDEYNNGYLMYGYIHDEKIVGFLSLYKDGGIMNISDIVILPEYQNRGIGSRLMEFAEEKARELNCTRIALGMIYDNIPLRKWYEKRGFQTVKLVNFETVRYTVGNMEMEV